MIFVKNFGKYLGKVFNGSSEKTNTSLNNPSNHTNVYYQANSSATTPLNNNTLGIYNISASSGRAYSHQKEIINDLCKKLKNTQQELNRTVFSYLKDCYPENIITGKDTLNYLRQKNIDSCPLNKIQIFYGADLNYPNNQQQFNANITECNTWLCQAQNIINEIGNLNPSTQNNYTQPNQNPSPRIGSINNKPYQVEINQKINHCVSQLCDTLHNFDIGNPLSIRRGFDVKPDVMQKIYNGYPQERNKLIELVNNLELAKSTQSASQDTLTILANSIVYKFQEHNCAIDDDILSRLKQI